MLCGVVSFGGEFWREWGEVPIKRSRDCVGDVVTHSQADFLVYFGS